MRTKLFGGVRYEHSLLSQAGWIEELASVTWSPELLCRIANVAEKEMGKWTLKYFAHYTTSISTKL